MLFHFIYSILWLQNNYVEKGMEQKKILKNTTFTKKEPFVQVPFYHDTQQLHLFAVGHMISLYLEMYM